MGAPMVRRLVDAGHYVVALGRTAEKRTPIAELGACAVTSIAEVASCADITRFAYHRRLFHYRQSSAVTTRDAARREGGCT
jgi:3-hydroxyisobutyrate dehydrogenase-like beta-hydroxyacid dehydrogenase